VHGGTTVISSAQFAPDLAGTVLEGAYRLVRMIGQGGMGAVYEAVQLRLNKRVAIKLMSKSEVSDMVSLMRFHREAEITSRLGHPHLVNVVDFGTAETGQPYLVMEYLEGEDLDQRLLRATTVPAETAARIVMQTASALGAAHAQDIVHRDLKPANIFLLQVPGEPEFVKVLDFGISKIKAASAKRLTGVRSVVGTPSYMSPEQAMGRADDTDHRADQWALACIAWEMLCGHPPFVADDVTALFYQITRLDPPSLAREVPYLRPGTEDVLRRALSKRHLDRYPSIRQFGRALESAVLGYTTDVTPTPVSLPVTSDVGVSRTTPPKVTSDHLIEEIFPTTPGPASPTGASSIEPAPVTEHLPRYRSARRWLLVAAVGSAVALAAIALFRSRSPTQPALPESTREVYPRVVKLPSSSPPIITPTHAAVGSEAAAVPEPAPAPPDKPTRVKPAPGTRSRATGRAKHKAVNVQPKHRLFEEL
jgi:serine/threonine protein kinase